MFDDGLIGSARALIRAARSQLQLGLSYLPASRARHRALQQRAARDDHHLYTCFYRSPRQLDALAGPVCRALEQRGLTRVNIAVFAASTGAEAYTIASELLHRRPALDFTVRASDLHPETVRKASEAVYTVDEVTAGGRTPREFVERTFDPAGPGRWVVKEHVRARVSFEQADLLDEGLPARFPPADLVFAQNVLCHLSPPLARRAFDNVLGVLRPRGFLFVDGMDLDLRVELTRACALSPVDYEVKGIYREARGHVPANWWSYYYGSEPYLWFASDRLRRYCTIFEAAAA